MEQTERTIPVAHHRHQPVNINQVRVETLGPLDRVGLLITKSVGTMTAAILFTCLSLLSLPAAIASHNQLVIISWIAQTFLQLVLLPIILVGQNIQGRHSELMADEEYKTTQTTYKDLEHLILVNKQQLDLLIELTGKAK
ncbi:hypothetical protein KGQ71_00990 [Patescibacteria group bacterium]|nr:hypothetical protein [Patescibacteria group bacterium]